MNALQYEGIPIERERLVRIVVVIFVVFILIY